MPTTYTLINSNVLSSSAASVTFSSIPATYTDLVLRVSGRQDNGPGPLYQIRFNSDTASNYSGTWFYGDGSAIGNYRQTNTTFRYIGYSDGTPQTSNTFSNDEIYISNYTSTAAKPFSHTTNSENNNSTQAYILAAAGLYRNSSALSSLEISCSSGNWVSGSSFYLYGISNA